MEVLTYLAKSALLVSIFYMAYEFLLKKETFFSKNRYFLLSGIVMAFGLPLVIFENIHYIATTTPTGSISQTFQETPSPLPIAKSSFLTTANTLLWIYIGVTTLLVIKFIVTLSSLFIIILKQKNSFQHNGITYRYTSRNIGPFSFFNTIVLNPSLYNDEELQMIKAHEEVHAKQWHSFDLLLAKLATILLWFNPFAWLYQKNIQENLEFIADSETLKENFSIKKYQLSLVKESVKNRHAIPVTNFHHSFIKKRIVMLHKSKSNHIKFLKTVFILPFLVCFLWGFQVKTIEKAEQNNIPPSMASLPTKEKTYTIEATATDADLKRLKRKIEKELKGTEIRFSGIKRNKNHEIIAIAIEAKYDDGDYQKQMSFNSEGDDAISSIFLTAQGNDISITTNDQHPLTTVISKNGSTTTGINNYKVVRINETKFPDTLRKKENTIYLFQDSTSTKEEKIEREIQIINDNLDNTTIEKETEQLYKKQKALEKKRQVLEEKRKVLEKRRIAEEKQREKEEAKRKALEKKRN